MKKTYVFFLGIFFTLVLMEIGIRIFGGIYNFSSDPKALHSSKTEYRILCLGNSYTKGYGVAPEDTYPAILNEKLGKLFGLNKIHVINRGRNNVNTTNVLDLLPHDIEETKPDLVIIMAGEPNFWKRYGFSRYLKYKDKKSASATIAEFLNYSRVYRFFETYLFKEPISDDDYASYNLQEKAMYWLAKKQKKEIFYDSKTNFYTNFSQDEALEIKSTLELYLKSSGGDQIKSIREMYFILVDLYANFFHDWKQAIYYVERSIHSSDDFDVMAHKFISNVLKNEKIDAVTKKELVKMLGQINSKHPGDRALSLFYRLGKLASELTYSVDGYSTGIKQVVVDKDVRQAIAMRPAYLPFYRLLLNSSDLMSDSEIAGISIDALNAFPLRQNAGHFFNNLFEVKMRTKSNELKNKIDAFLVRYRTSFPHSGYDRQLYSTEYNAETLGWIKYDFKQILNFLKNRNIPVLVQGYHWLRSSSQLEIALNGALAEVALKENAPFSDTYRYFMGQIENAKDPEDSYYIDSKGKLKDAHLSKKGHEIIANKILQDLTHFNFLNRMQFKKKFFKEKTL